MWTREKINALLDVNPLAVERGLVAIYERQTADEKAIGRTKVHNGVGFGAYDSEFMSDVARKVKAGRRLTPNQLAVVRNRLKRYGRQLVEIANEKELAKQAVANPAPVPAEDVGNREERLMVEQEAAAMNMSGHW